MINCSIHTLVGTMPSRSPLILRIDLTISIYNNKNSQ